MNARLRTTRWSLLVLTVCMAQCVMEPPIVPPGAGSGYSLDSGPNRRRSREDTRYLEATQAPPLPNPSPDGTQLAGPPAPAYETPADIDPSLPPGSTANTSSPANPSSADTGTPNSSPPSPPSPETQPTGPAAAPKPAGPEQLPFGLPVPNKKGFVYSPFDKTQLVDVRGIPPGKKVRCPYTSKIFLVP